MAASGAADARVEMSHQSGGGADGARDSQSSAAASNAPSNGNHNHQPLLAAPAGASDDSRAPSPAINGFNVPPSNRGVRLDEADEVAVHHQVREIPPLVVTQEFASVEADVLGYIEDDPEVPKSPRPFPRDPLVIRFFHDASKTTLQLMEQAGYSWFWTQKQAIRDLLVPSGPLATDRGTCFNLVNATVGGGMLALPKAYGWSGWALQTVLLLMLVHLSQYTANLLVRVSYAEAKASFTDLTIHLCGRRVGVATQYLMLIGNFGVLIAYVVLIADFLVLLGHKVLGEDRDVDRTIWTLVVCTALVLPLALKRQLNELRWCSVGLVVCVLFYVCSVIYKTLDALSRDGVAPDVAAAHFDNNIFRALPVIAFAAYHHVYALPIFREMKDPTPERFARVERVTFFIIEVWYLVPALLSYLVFGPEVAGNNLDNFRGDLLMSVVTGGYLLIIVFVFPLALFAVRLNLHFLVFGETETITRMQHWSETLLLFGGAMAIGLSVSDVSLVFSLIGAVSTSLLAFILPAVLLLRSAKTASSELEKTGARLVVFFGIVLAVLGVVTTFLDGLGITF